MQIGVMVTVTLMPQWNALTKFLDKYNVKHEEFEDSRDKDVIDQANIAGFPTIKISKIVKNMIIMEKEL